MAQLPWRALPLTKEEGDELFMLLFVDDAGAGIEGLPGATMGDLEFWCVSTIAHSLRSYARHQGLGWTVAGLLTITFTLPNVYGEQQLTPDAFVAFVPERAREIFDVAIEGVFPPFMLQVVTPASAISDEQAKRRAYELLGVREYALFTPREEGRSWLEGYRLGTGGRFDPWLPDEQGRFWSETLGLYLIGRGPLLQAQTAEGRVLLPPEETNIALREAQAARHHEQEARQRAEEEVERLRRELARLGGTDPDSAR